ncbi:TPA: helix-turn-helix domain-containing protein [Escherichia coli]
MTKSQDWHPEDIKAAIRKRGMTTSQLSRSNGLRSFALELQSASKPVVHYQWSPVAGGNKKLARLLERLQ